MRAYHGVLERLKIKPHRSLEDDLELQTGVMSYGGSSSTTVPALSHGSNSAIPAHARSTATSSDSHACPCGGPKPSECGCKHESAPDETCSKKSVVPQFNGRPDFSKMTQAEKLAWNKAERDRIFGS